MKFIKKLINESKIVGIAFILFYVLFQIHYHKESMFIVLKAVFAHFYLFIIPGYSLCLILKLKQTERFIIALGVGYGLQPFLLYLINFLTQVNIMKYNLYVSAILIILGIVLAYIKWKK